MNIFLNASVLLLVFSIPIEQIIHLPGLGTITRVMGILAFLVWLANLILERRIRKPHLFHVIAILFFLWSLCSIVWSQYLTASFERANTYIQLGILILILWDQIKTESSFRAALQAYIFGVYVSVASTYSSFLSGNHGKYGRFAAGEFDDNDLGIIISLGIPMAWYLFSTCKGRNYSHILRNINIAFIPIATSGILLTASRTAMLSLAPSMLYIVLSLQKVSFLQKFVVFALGLSAIFTLPLVIPADTFARLSTVGDSVASGDLNGRAGIWKEGLYNYFQEPLWGVGSGAFSSTVEAGLVAHNTFLSPLFEVGFIGFALFLLAFLISFILSTRCSRLWLVVFSIFLIGAMSLSWEHRKPTWVVMSLGIIHSQCHEHLVKGKKYKDRRSFQINAKSVF